MRYLAFLFLFLSAHPSWCQDNEIQVFDENDMIDLHLQILDAETYDTLLLAVMIVSVDSVELVREIADIDGKVYLSVCPEQILNKTVTITAHEHGYFSKTVTLSINQDTTLILGLNNNPDIKTTKEGLDELHNQLIAQTCGTVSYKPEADIYYEYCDGRVLAEKQINQNNNEKGIWKRLSYEPYLIPICQTIDCETGDAVCFINPMSDTIIPYGKYTVCGFQNVIKDFGAVMGKKKGKSVCLAIDNKGNELYEIYWFDNGPDYIECGLFRIMKDGKIGFANAQGKIIIEPQFTCADFFRDGLARVTYSCTLVPNGEHTAMQSDAWFYIDANGKRVEP